ncbi:MAG TPA: site-2 protease family protein [Candidatus Polarisedimenticolaceae bacterium]|nr:site-2 protease family protein [Candidatus Polarisedimenticolaceae bacterium]
MATARTTADLLRPQAIVEAIVAGLPYGFWTIAILAAHEMGHYLACRHYGIPVTLPFFIPGPPLLVGSFGALIRIRGRIPDRKALFDVAAAGPLSGFAVALPVLLVGVAVAEPSPAASGDAGLWLGDPLVVSLYAWLVPRAGTSEANQLIGAGWVGMLVTSLNLFPVGQLDGGHATYAISRRLHRALAWVSLAGMAVLLVYQVVALEQAPAYLIWFAILLWMRDRHPPLVDEAASIGAVRVVLAGLLLLIFVLSFIPIPLTVIDG